MNVIHINVCPDCGESDHAHWMDPPPFPPPNCKHERERFVPVRYVELDAVLEHLREATTWSPATGRDRAVSGWRAAADELEREFGGSS